MPGMGFFIMLFEMMIQGIVMCVMFAIKIILAVVKFVFHIIAKIVVGIIKWIFKDDEPKMDSTYSGGYSYNSGGQSEYDSYSGGSGYSNAYREEYSEYNNYDDGHHSGANNVQAESENTYFQSMFDNATSEQAELVYKKLVKVYHPDMPSGDEEQMKMLTAAYEQYKQRQQAG